MSITPSIRSEADSVDNLASYLDLRTENCNAFRILVCGKSGVGKTSLVSRVFGFNGYSEISDYQPGVHNIDHEIRSPRNQRLILHDSCGLESGSPENLQTIREFIHRRRNSTPSETLHAIWYCTEVPTSGERIFEGGDLTFFKELKKQSPVPPVIIVFTKYDRLVFREQESIKEQKLRNDPNLRPREAARQAKAEGKTKAAAIFEEKCVKVMKSKLPRVWNAYCKVSRDDETSIGALVNITTDALKGSSQLLWATAQTTDVDLKVAGSSHAAGENLQLDIDEESLLSTISRTTTEVWEDNPVYSPLTADGSSLNINMDRAVQAGRSRHWRAIASSAIPIIGLRRVSTLTVLRLVHRDIVRIWNFPDPDNILKGAVFRQQIRNLFVEPLISSKIEHAQEHGETSPLIDNFVDAMTDPTGASAVKFAGNAAVSILNEVALSTPATARILMAYVANLTLGMECLFYLLRKSDKTRITRQDVTDAYVSFYKSGALHEVNLAVRDYIGDEEVFKAFKRDKAAQKTRDIINAHRYYTDHPAQKLPQTP
ncbi:hypothetical protein SISNIDRAFT_496568 [Sistotremastrum niveocremeum HHB9708]|uniref:G domain-containing protein n=1 Tax=Sistotremastrum niveocremeum HHB9708 TaxID=1314777 RepID=A0A164SII4_9AGAM|nr:hypothetical protein SISNIDRAFT_496568 [Sistotremastrum niveocremeum HHB9708]